MMPVPHSEMKGFRNCPAMKKCNRKPCACCSCDKIRPSKSKTKSTPTSVGPLNMIESEYIKNLQLQIYYLEMESKYLWKRTQEQEAPKKTDDRSYGQYAATDKAIDPSWEKSDNKYFNKAHRESPSAYSRYKSDDLGKYEKPSSFEKSRSYEKPSSYGRPSCYKPSSYKTSIYDCAGKYYSPLKSTTDYASDYATRGSEINNDLERLIQNVKTQDAAIKKLNLEKTKATEMLNQEKQSHAKDMRQSRDDLVLLQQEIDSERQHKMQCEMDLNRLTDDLKKAEDNLRQLQLDKSIVHNQMAQRDQQLRSVKSDLDETRSGLQKREEDIKDLQEKYDKSHDLFNRVAAEMRDEHKVLRENLSKADMKIQELESNRDSLIDTNHRLIKENSSLDTAVNELQGQLQQDRSILADTEKQREMAADKISSMANDIKIIRKELQDSKQKVAELDGKLRETMENLYVQEAHNERLEKRLSSETNRVTELETIRERLADDIRELQDERSVLVDRTSLLESEVGYQRSEIEQLQTTAHGLNSQLKEVEGLKNLQSTMQTQKWEEFGKLANSMHNISRCMSHNNGTTVIIETD